jgi:hypothetical protein
MVLIVGSGSCGSTLLAQLLDNHPQVACGAELGLFSKPIFYEAFETLKEYAEVIRVHGVSSRPYFDDRSILRNLEQYPIDPDALWTVLATSKTFVEFVGVIQKAILAATKKNIWVEKTPENTYLLKAIKTTFPGTKVIHLYRDPRDVVLSFIKRGHTVVSGSEVWLSSLSALQAANLSSSELLEISYEALVERTSECMHRICAFIDLPWDDAYISDSRYQSPGLPRKDGFSSWSLSPSGGISNQRVNSHKSSPVDLSDMNNIMLSPEFAAHIGSKTWTMRDLANHYGYSFSWNEPKTRTMRQASAAAPTSSFFLPFSLYDRACEINRILVGID